eukprot:Em0019g1066a
MNVWLAMEGVLRYAPILLEASPVPATLATLLVLMQDHVWVRYPVGFKTATSSVCVTGQIRVQDGSTSFNGRVEVCYNDVWGTVCDDLFNDVDASVACRQLGYSAGGIVAPFTYYPQGAGSIWLDNVQCLGTESRLFDCPNVGIGIHDCTHIEDVGVMCEINECLASNGGCAQICTNTVGSFTCSCNTGYSLGADARSCVGGGTALSFAYYGQGTGSIWLDDVGCVGTEARLWDCANSGIGIHNCDHSEDASVQCSVCVTGQIRVQDGSTSFNGRVEVCYNDVWGTVCDDLFNDVDASVACRQLGYSAGGIVAPFTYYPQGAGSIWLDNVQCLGTESRLFDCPNVGIGIHDCTHIEDVGVMCEINECLASNGGCAQICTNTVGSFTCSCNTGYSLGADARSCVVASNECIVSSLK